MLFNVEFRANRNETDSTRLDKQIHLAKKGLAQLSMYSNLSNQQGNWSVDLDQEPMPQPKPKEP